MATYRYLRDAKGNIIPESRYEVGSSQTTPTTSSGSGGGGGGGGGASAPSPSVEVVTSPPPLSLRQANPFRYNYLVRQYNAYVGNLNATARAEEQKKSYDTPLYDESSGTLLYKGQGYSVAPEKVNAMIQQLQTVPVAAQPIATEKKIEILKKPTSFFIEPKPIRVEVAEALAKYSEEKPLTAREAFLVANAKRIELQRQARQKVDLAVGKKFKPSFSELTPDLRVGKNTYELPDYTGRQISFAIQSLNFMGTKVNVETKKIIIKSKMGTITPSDIREYQELIDKYDSQINEFNNDIQDLNVNIGLKNAWIKFAENERIRQKKSLFNIEQLRAKNKIADFAFFSYEKLKPVADLVTNTVNTSGQLFIDLPGQYAGIALFAFPGVRKSLTNLRNIVADSSSVAWKVFQARKPRYAFSGKPFQPKKFSQLKGNPEVLSNYIRNLNYENFIKTKRAFGEVSGAAAEIYVATMTGKTGLIIYSLAADSPEGLLGAAILGSGLGFGSKLLGVGSNLVYSTLGKIPGGQTVYAYGVRQISGKVIPLAFGVFALSGVSEIAAKGYEGKTLEAKALSKQLAGEFAYFGVGARVGEFAGQSVVDVSRLSKAILFKDYYPSWTIDIVKSYSTAPYAQVINPKTPLRLREEAVRQLKKVVFVPKDASLVRLPERTSLEYNVKQWLKRNTDVALKGSRNLYAQAVKKINYPTTKDFDFQTINNAKLKAESFNKFVLGGKGKVKAFEPTKGVITYRVNYGKTTIADFSNGKVRTIITGEGISLVDANHEILVKWAIHLDPAKAYRREKDLDKLLEAIRSYGRKGKIAGSPVFTENIAYHSGATTPFIKNKSFTGKIITPSKWEKITAQDKYPITFFGQNELISFFRKGSPDAMILKNLKVVKRNSLPKEFQNPAKTTQKAITQTKRYLEYINKYHQGDIVPSPQTITSRTFTGIKTSSPEKEWIIMGTIKNLKYTGFSFDPYSSFSQGKFLKLITNYPLQGKSIPGRAYKNVKLILEDIKLGLLKRLEVTKLPIERKNIISRLQEINKKEIAKIKPLEKYKVLHKKINYAKTTSDALPIYRQIRNIEVSSFVPYSAKYSSDYYYNLFRKMEAYGRIERTVYKPKIKEGYRENPYREPITKYPTLPRQAYREAPYKSSYEKAYRSPERPIKRAEYRVPYTPLYREPYSPLKYFPYREPYLGERRPPRRDIREPPYVPPMPPGIPQISLQWQKFSGEIRKRQATDVYTRKGKKYIKLNRTPLTPRAALITGHQFIENDPSRTILLKKTVGYPKDIVGIFPYWQYRPPKGNSIYGKNAIIEKARYAINTPGEKSGISLKGKYFRKRFK